MLFFGKTILDQGKSVHVALTQIYGIGAKRSKAICYQLGIQPNCTFHLLNPGKIPALKKLLEIEVTGPVLKRKINHNVQKLILKRCYRGTRHRRKLPVRGQRTHTNAKIQKKIFRK